MPSASVNSKAASGVGGIELGPVERLALEDASAEFLKCGLNVRLVRYGIFVWFCTHGKALE